RNLYKALVEAYESNKIILDTYADTVTWKRRRDNDADKDEEPSAGSDRGSKRRREGKEPESDSAPREKATRSADKSTQRSKSRQTSASESATADEPMLTTFEMEEPLHSEFETGVDDQPIVESSQHHEWFSQQKKPPTLDRDCNKTLPTTPESIQPWISELAKQSDSRSSFNELMDTPVDFSAFLMNRLKVDTLSPELLAGLTYELMKGSCKSLVELEFFLEEVYKATTDQLDWVNPEGQQYPHNLLKPLPLIPNSRGRRVFPFDHFINNDLEYLRGEENFFEFTQMNRRMNEAVKVAVQLQSDRLRDEAQKENDEFLKTIDENMQKIIKEQVKEQVKVQISKILPKIEQTVNEQLEAEVLTRSSNSSKTSYDVAADLSEMELKKILIEKMEGNKSIHRSNEQMTLYKALVEAYESDKIILDTYGDTVTLKTCRDDDADKDEEPSAGSDRGSKRHIKGKEPESKSASKEKATMSAGKSTQRSKYRQTSASESAIAEEPIVEPSQHPEWFSQQKKPPTPDRDWNKTLPATHESIQLWISELAKQTDSRSSFNELMDTPMDFSNFLMNRLKVDTLTPELLAGPTYELMKGSYKSLVELKFFLEEVYKATTDQLDWVNPESQEYPYNLLKPLPLIPNSRRRRVIPFDYFINNDLEYLHGCASSHKYTTYVTKTKAADCGHIKWIKDLHLDWITIRRDDDKLYKFKEGDFKRLLIQDIEDMLLLLVQGKLTNLIVEERFAFNVSLQMFTRSINIDKQYRLMRIDELHKFIDGTLTDVRTALDDRLKGIHIKYLPQTICRKSVKERAAAMIQAIDKRLKTRRITRSL
nr:hypothetical protein [Tanacetum cinerariifolium]